MEGTVYTIKSVESAKMTAQPVKKIRIFHGSIPKSYLPGTTVVRIFRSKDKAKLASIFFYHDGTATLSELGQKPNGAKSRCGIKIDTKTSHLNTRTGEVVVVASGNVSGKMYATISYEYDEIPDDL